MKKIILLAAVALISLSVVNAQEFQRGDWAANVGISLSHTDPLVFGGSVEHGIIDNVFDLSGFTFGLGAELGFASKTVHGFTVSSLMIGVRAPFHYSPVGNLDLYTAPGIYHVSAKGSVLGISSTTSKMQFGWTLIGARYFLSSNVGAFVELGFDTPFEMGAGVTFRF